LLQRHWPNSSATKGQKGLVDILLENVGEEDVKKLIFHVLVSNLRLRDEIASART